MNEDFWLLSIVAVVWALLALVYALAPWADMIGMPASGALARCCSSASPRCCGGRSDGSLGKMPHAAHHQAPVSLSRDSGTEPSVSRHTTVSPECAATAVSRAASLFAASMLAAPGDPASSPPLSQQESQMVSIGPGPAVGCRLARQTYGAAWPCRPTTWTAGRTNSPSGGPQATSQKTARPYHIGMAIAARRSMPGRSAKRQTSGLAVLHAVAGEAFGGFGQFRLA